jgi:hypothetical protein
MGTRQLSRLALLAASALLAAACSGKSGTDSTAEPQCEGPTVGEHAQNQAVFDALKPTCEGCHSTGARGYFASLTAFESLVVYEPKEVVPGKPDESQLILVLEGKGDLVTSLTLRATSIANTGFDVHFSGGARAQTSHLRIALEAVGQMLNEMSLTPASSGTGTLLDETLVYIYSDFGRTFAHSGEDGTDHHPATCGILVGGNVKGNQMLGGYDETAQGSPLGAPVPILGADKAKVVRTATSADIAATVVRAFGLTPETDFRIPGSYGEFQGALVPG